jgi:hypothetical protein
MAAIPTGPRVSEMPRIVGMMRTAARSRKL